MKTTIEISDDLFARTQELARRRHTSFRAITEEGLRLVLEKKEPNRSGCLPPLVTFKGNGATETFQDWDWQTISEEIYRGRGA